MLRIAVAGYAKSIENFSYVVSAVLTPLFLVARHVLPAAIHAMERKLID